MKKPFITRLPATRETHREHGVTMVLVAVAMVAIVAMAALSIDVITLYLAKEEAQRAADTAALAAAKVISLSGITGDPNNSSGYWGRVCGPDDGTNGLATRVAKSVAGQNTIGGTAATTPTVTYSVMNGPGTTDCASLSTTGFGINPIVTVTLTRASLPGFFSRIWGNAGSTISATATAEAFNSSNSASQTAGTLIPVQPRCVKPWVVPNLDPGGTGVKFVDNATGAIQRPGISLSGATTPGVIGETFWLVPDCTAAGIGSCTLITQPTANYPTASRSPNVLYVPGQVGTPVIGVPSCTSFEPYELAIEGCDQPNNYSCGVPSANLVDLSENPIAPTVAGVQCLTHQVGTDITNANGQDQFDTLGAPSSFPFQIYAGAGSAAVAAGLASGSPVTASTSIVSLPIYDNATTISPGPAATPVTFVGFLQVFINAVDANGNIKVTVLNVTGCSNGSGMTVGTPIFSNSPVPVRLVTPPAGAGARF